MPPAINRGNGQPEQRDLDVVIFGATGFTGAAAVFESVKLLAGLRWGVAGRSEEKLRTMLADVGQRSGGRDLVAQDGVQVLVADVADADSLLRMAKRAKVRGVHVERLCRMLTDA